MSDTPKPTEVQTPDLQAPTEVHMPPKPTVTTEEHELQNPTPSETTTTSNVNTGEDNAEEYPHDFFTLTVNVSISDVEDPIGDQEAESKHSLGNDNEETGRIEESDRAYIFRRSATLAVNKWVDYVLDQWLNSADRRPDEFLSIVAWGNGAEFLLKAIPSTSPRVDVKFGVDVTFGVDAGVDEPAVLCDRGGKEKDKTDKETSPVG